MDGSLTIDNEPRDGVIIEPMLIAHIPEVRAIERGSFPFLWPPNSYINELKINRIANYIICRRGEKIIGYAGVWNILDEAHITTVGVHPEYRNQKVGKKLVFYMLSESRKRGARWATLEVGEKNEAAVNLYQDFGFKQIGKRKEYYETRENALVMWLGNMQGQPFGDTLDRIEKELVFSEM